ncbi:hypothetical protein JHN59_40620 [Streptomyces sp. MBT49]|uniref:hypothetical protein n=1 Tax=unclassified Streptomyces TaxID=2593676 RepID=UPI00190A21EF|nr:MULTISPECIES: hypothetical protein [unclassified Streptomyces]MBK3630983.1 hypothetical protein [Streptomyces sp. MBT49]MBK3637848.1 hypothetical protein [Streptomyces sp. MBT97]
MLGPYRYFCPACGLESDPYFLKRTADEIGEGHRHERHGGLHPVGECILPTGEIRAPQGGERSAVLAFAVIMLLAFGAKLIGLV